ncbi:MAG TPA: peptidoglycan DD-metalloendopeptidase family protein [Gaiellaceae bacterium]|nr:peptidoglycan DD-metalloendopeptidase family protein [Gaiellaceae bacterium]
MFILTTIRRLALILVVFLAWTPAAYAWSWPVQGPVLQAFSYDEAHPYASGQHRGIDIGADAAGETVVAPAAGTISFAGTVPTSGKSVTIVTDDGYAVTLTHLGSILVVKGATVAERDAIGAVGPSGTAEVAGPYVHLGIRHAIDPDGYVDPLGLLPPASAPAQPSSNGGSSTASGSAPSATATSPATSATQPASSEPASRPAPTSTTPTVSKPRTRVSSHARGRAQEAQVETRSGRSTRRPELQRGEEAIARTARPRAARGLADGRPTSASRRPVVEAAASARPTVLDAGHEIRPSVPVAQLSPSRRPMPASLLPLVLNGAAAVVAVAAALLAARGRRRRCSASSATAAVHVFHLPRREVAHRPESRAA